KPWQTRLALLPSHASPPQRPLACGEACWQGEAAVAVVARTRAQAEDALELIEVGWAELPAVVSVEAAVPPSAPVVNSVMSNNLGLDHSALAGDPDRGFRDAAVIVEHDF